MQEDLKISSTLSKKGGREFKNEDRDRGGVTSDLKVRRVSEGTSCTDIDRLRKASRWDVFYLRVGVEAVPSATMLSLLSSSLVVTVIPFTFISWTPRSMANRRLHVCHAAAS